MCRNTFRILSGFYGILKPMDGVTPYRLEMQAKLELNGAKNLYAYWGDRLYKELRDSSGIIVNLASKEYSKCIEKYLQAEDSYITCNFFEEVQGKLVQKGVYCKMARGEMVRFMAENRIEEPEESSISLLWDITFPKIYPRRGIYLCAEMSHKNS